MGVFFAEWLVSLYLFVAGGYGAVIYIKVCTINPYTFGGLLIKKEDFF